MDIGVVRQKISPFYLVLSSFKKLRTILNPGDNQSKTEKRRQGNETFLPQQPVNEFTFRP